MRTGFPDSSVGKESACKAGDPSSIPVLGRSTGEGRSYPHQWASLVAQLVKNLPAMWETWVRSLGWEDPLEKGKATHSSILTWRIPRGHKEPDTTEQLSLKLRTGKALGTLLLCQLLSWVPLRAKGSLGPSSVWTRTASPCACVLAHDHASTITHRLPPCPLGSR